MNIQLAVAGLLMGLIALTACTQNKIALKANWPTPTVKQLPLTVGVIYHSSIVNHLHEEDPPIGRSWIIDLGQTQKTLLQKTLSSSFNRVLELQDLDQISSIQAPLVGVLIPELKEFQFATPAQTRKPDFEIWLQYQINILSPEGQLLKEWIINAYGKEQVSGQRLPKQLMHAALKKALRDFSASLSLGLQTLPEIQGWLAAPSNE